MAWVNTIGVTKIILLARVKLHKLALPRSHIGRGLMDWAHRVKDVYIDPPQKV